MNVPSRVKVLIALGVLSVMVMTAGVSYAFISLVKTNKALKAQIEAKTDISSSSKAVDVGLDLSTSSVNISSSSKPEEKVVVEKKVVYVPQVISTSNVDAQNNANASSGQSTNQSEAQDTVTDDSAPIATSSSSTTPTKITSVVKQTAYSNKSGGVYGSYEVVLSITAHGGDILIPKTTTNSIGTGFISFSYSIVGGDFSGKQDSKVSCTLTHDGLCKVPDGETRDITTTIWLYPDEAGDGNYALKFDQFRYMQDDQTKTYNLDKQTAAINIYH